MLGNVENLGFLFLTFLVVILGGMLVVRLAQGDVLAPDQQGDPALIGLPGDSPEPSAAPTLSAALPKTVPQDSSSAAPDAGARPSPSPTAAPVALPTMVIAASTSVAVSVGGATSVDETGGEVELAFVVRNAGATPVSIVGLFAEPGGAIAGGVDCRAGATLAAASDCTFSSTMSLPGGKAGTSIPVTFRAVVAPAQLAPQASTGAPQASTLPAGASQATATIRLTYLDVLPILAITAEGPASVPETGGSGTWTVTVRNAASVVTTVEAISVAPFGAVPAGTCAGAALAEAETCTLQATLNLSAAAAGSTAGLTFSASGRDAEGNVAKDALSTSVAYADVPPHVAVAATGPESVAASGGTVTFRLTVTNDGPVPATIAQLQSGPIEGTVSGGCGRGTTLAVRASCTAQVAVRLPAGDPATPASVAISATVSDREGNQVTATDTRAVAYLPAPGAPASGSGTTGSGTPGSGTTGSGTAGQSGQSGTPAPTPTPATAPAAEDPDDAPPATDTIAGKHVVVLSPVQLALLGGAFGLTLLGLAWWLPRRRAALVPTAATAAPQPRQTERSSMANRRAERAFVRLAFPGQLVASVSTIAQAGRRRTDAPRREWAPWPWTTGGSPGRRRPPGRRRWSSTAGSPPLAAGWRIAAWSPGSCPSIA